MASPEQPCIGLVLKLDVSILAELEARRLMLNERLDVSRAAFAVGYESPSRFSREYGRLFGAAPRQDIALLRGQVPESRSSGEAAQAY